ncbi:hypothetical protein CDAR_263451 [Caerostris darwini]|uniref:Uncharacterized protein n=1 Tax=Caerostris darwini TaxID=1538125 RepID=A0AAV4RX26_9ARAC|nr:hypothetical protein CDAR_263451 [Caerostris darwini]
MALIRARPYSFELFFSRKVQPKPKWKENMPSVQFDRMSRLSGGPESSLTVQIILEGEWEKFFLCVGNPFRLSSFPEISPGLLMVDGSGKIPNLR